MNPRLIRLETFGHGSAVLLAVAMALAWRPALAGEPALSSSIGVQSVGLTVGPFFPIRVLSGQSSKLFGAAAMPAWSITLTDPLGTGWYHGQVSVGAELLAFGTYEPVPATGIGFTPTLRYTLNGWHGLQPYVEGGGGPLWTDLGGRVPEQPGQFNFVVWGGAGCSWRVSRQWAIQAGYRFVHISNAGPRSENGGLNFGLPFVGFSYRLF